MLIQRPIADVWSFLSDLRNESQWWRGVYRSDRLEGDGGVGTRYYLHATLIGIPSDADVLVTKFQPPQLIAIKATGRLVYTCDYHLAPAGEHTLLHLLINIERLPQWLSPLFEGLVAYNLRRLRGVLAH